MTEEQCHIILHSLGLASNKSKSGIGFRNHYVSAETLQLTEMVELGWIRRFNGSRQFTEYLYVVTRRGLEAAGLSWERDLDRETSMRKPP